MEWLNRAAAMVTNLEGVVLIQLPDCKEWASWTKAHWDTSEVAAYFGDISRANRNAMHIVDGPSDAVRVTIEASEHIILSYDLRVDLVVVYIFTKGSPLGLVRLNAKRLCKVIMEHLPEQVVVERPRAERVMEFLLRYAPDPHAVPMRVALQTGIPLPMLQNPAQMTAEQTTLLETAARAILGTETLRI